MSTIAFIRWFGPRGLPSLVLARILIFERLELTSGLLMSNVLVATAAVAISVQLHGFSAAPLSDRYAH